MLLWRKDGLIRAASRLNDFDIEANWIAAFVAIQR